MWFAPPALKQLVGSKNRKYRNEKTAEHIIRAVLGKIFVMAETTGFEPVKGF